jgi:hypothetical protein
MPKVEYKNSNGQKLTGVTTILGNNLAWNKGALIGWAYNQGKAGLPLRDQKALDIGTLAHAWIECDIKNKEERPTIPEELRNAVENSCLAYLEWKDQVHFKLIQSELSLISEMYQFGGTIDIIGEVNGQQSIIDLKTGDKSEVYPDWRIQVAAYKNLYDECYPKNPIKMVYILKLGKKDGGFGYNYFPDLTKEWKTFLLLLQLEKFRKEMT